MKNILKKVMLVNLLIVLLDVLLLSTGTARVSNSTVVDEISGDEYTSWIVESEFSVNGKWYKNECLVYSPTHLVQEVHYDIFYPKHNCADGYLFRREFWLSLPLILIIIVRIARGMTSGEANILESFLSVFGFWEGEG